MILSCQKDYVDHNSNQRFYSQSFEDQNNIAKILSKVLKTSEGQDIFLNTLKQGIVTQDDTTLIGLYSVPLFFLFDKKASNNKEFSILWDSLSATVDTSYGFNYLINEFIPNYPGIGVSIFDPQERLEKNLTSLDQDFQVAFVDNSMTSFPSYKDGQFEDSLDIQNEPNIMIILLQEDIGYWMLTASDISSMNNFFNATGYEICSLARSNLNTLNMNQYFGYDSIEINSITVSNPIKNYYLINQQDFILSFNEDCHQEDYDDEDLIGMMQEECDRDLWQNMKERIIRFRFNTAGAQGLLKNRQCNWTMQVCYFLIAASIPQLASNQTEFYGRPVEKVWGGRRKELSKGGWVYTNELAFGDWLFLEGQMGKHWVHTFIQKNKKAGQEKSFSVNAKFSGGATFRVKVDENTSSEVNLNVEVGVGYTVKYTEMDLELGDEIIQYCDCQSCNGWQGDTYSPGTFIYSVRECSSLPNCQFNQ